LVPSSGRRIYFRDVLVREFIDRRRRGRFETRCCEFGFDRAVVFDGRRRAVEVTRDLVGPPGPSIFSARCRLLVWFDVSVDRLRRRRCVGEGGRLRGRAMPEFFRRVRSVDPGAHFAFERKQRSIRDPCALAEHDRRSAFA
jgi:hypothetical protein